MPQVRAPRRARPRPVPRHPVRLAQADARRRAEHDDPVDDRDRRRRQPAGGRPARGGASRFDADGWHGAHPARARPAARTGADPLVGGAKIIRVRAAARRAGPSLRRAGRSQRRRDRWPEPGRQGWRRPLRDGRLRRARPTAMRSRSPAARSRSSCSNGRLMAAVRPAPRPLPRPQAPGRAAVEVGEELGPRPVARPEEARARTRWS